MGMKDRLGRVAQQAKDVGSHVKDEAATAGTRVEATRQAAGATVASVKDSAAAAGGKATSLAAEAKAALADLDFAEFFERLPVPSSPVDEHWRFSISKFITAGEKPPRGTGLLLKQLDRFGTIDIGPKEVGFDDTTAKWDKVKVLRTRTLDGIIEQIATDGVNEAISGSLPGVPGAGWVADKATGLLFVLAAMTYELALRDPEASRRQYACEIEYKGWIRTKEAGTGYFTGPCMALVPGLDEVFQAEAARRGVTIEAAEQTTFESAERRAAWLLEKQQALLARRAAIGKGRK